MGHGSHLNECDDCRRQSTADPSRSGAAKPPERRRAALVVDADPGPGPGNPSSSRYRCWAVTVNTPATGPADGDVGVAKHEGPVAPIHVHHVVQRLFSGPPGSVNVPAFVRSIWSLPWHRNATGRRAGRVSPADRSRSGERKQSWRACWPRDDAHPDGPGKAILIGCRDAGP